MQQGTKITLSNADVVLAISALEALAKDRGFPDEGTALCVGRTLRRLQAVQKEFQADHDVIVQNARKLDNDGNPVPATGGPGGVVLRDPPSYFAAVRKLEAETHEVEVFPISVVNLGQGDDAGRPKTCKSCKKVTGLPDPVSYATLLDLAILLERKADAA